MRELVGRAAPRRVVLVFGLDRPRCPPRSPLPPPPFPLRLARAAGDNVDFYDYKVKAAEGMTKAELFSVLDGLEAATRPLAAAARAALAKEKGDDALLPWNRPFALAGESERALDPHFDFRGAVGVWARTFAGLGIDYQGGEREMGKRERDEKERGASPAGAGFCVF